MKYFKTQALVPFSDIADNSNKSLTFHGSIRGWCDLNPLI